MSLEGPQGINPQTPGKEGILTEVGDLYHVRFSESDLEIIDRAFEIQIDCNRFLDSYPMRMRQGVVNSAKAYMRGAPTSDVGLFPPHILSGLHELRGFVQELSPKRQETFQTDLDALLQTSIDAQRATRVGRVIALRRKEARLSIEVILDLLPDETVNQPGFKKFKRRFQKLLEIYNVADSYADFSDDISGYKSSLRDTNYNKKRLRAAYMLAALKDSVLSRFTGRRVNLQEYADEDAEIEDPEY